MAKLRHIAIALRDPEACANFFERSFSMRRAGEAMREFTRWTEKGYRPNLFVRQRYDNVSLDG